MKMKLSSLLIVMTFFLTGNSALFAQLVEKVVVTDSETTLDFIAPNTYLLEIAGPNNYYSKEEVPYTQQIKLSSSNSDGVRLMDGSYSLQVTPIVKLTKEEQKELRSLTDGQKTEELKAYRMAHNLPAEVNVYNINFSIVKGKFVSPNTKEKRGFKKPSMSYEWQENHPSLYASINTKEFDFGTVVSNQMPLPMDTDAALAFAQVFTQDVVVQGSICIGLDCANGESFGFDTERLKENNLRIHFDDTSSSASFPSNDWRISINDSANGGASYFAVEDATAGRVPFRISAGAPANALTVDGNGDVGVGTANAVVELHVADGDSPTLRLEQNGSSGFGAQTWDVAGNETNFFIRDVTNGSLLPFRIRPRAPKNSIYIDAEGDIGFGTENPGSNGIQLEDGDLYVKNGALNMDNGNAYMKNGNLGINIAPSSFALDVAGNVRVEGTSSFTGDATFITRTGATFFSDSYASLMRLDGTNNKVIIGNAVTSVDLDVCGTISTSAMSVATSVACSSDKRFKKNIQTLDNSLSLITRLRGVTYDWDLKKFPAKQFNDRRQIGFIAQELEALFPELVTTDKEGYKAVDYAKITPVLVEAIKEQQRLINAQNESISELEEQVDALGELESKVTALSDLIDQMGEVKSSRSSSVEKE